MNELESRHKARCRRFFLSFSIILFIVGAAISILIVFPEPFDPFFFRLSKSYRFNKESNTHLEHAIRLTEIGVKKSNLSGKKLREELDFIESTKMKRAELTADNFPKYVFLRYILNRDINLPSYLKTD